MVIYVNNKIWIRGKDRRVWDVCSEEHLNNYLLEWKLIDNLDYVEALSILKTKEK